MPGCLDDSDGSFGHINAEATLAAFAGDGHRLYQCDITNADVNGASYLRS
ncbi:MAG: hypothetical protein GY806_14460 [Gammaproteobacteria bacterium]|nr:hypothetical protein [Gammaproteobacteria bacterium]